MFSKKFFFWFLVTLCFSIYLTLENIKALAAVGARIKGDELIIKDSLSSPISKNPRNRTINFEYPIINKVISYIELRSNSNAEIQFVINIDENNKGGNLIGSATAILSKDFHLDICIFGFNSSNKPEKFQAILRPEIGFTGEMKPNKTDNSDNEFNLEFNNVDFDDYIMDGYLEIGNRQSGDYLLYERVEHVNNDIKDPKTLTFYYVDRDYVTCAKIVTIKTTTAYPIYSEVTEHSLKAEIHDINVYSLSAKFQIYGYKPQDKPIKYYPMIKMKSNKTDYLNNLDETIREPQEKCKCSGSNNLKKFNLYLFVLSFILIFYAF